MALTYSKYTLRLGDTAPDFKLRGVDGKTYSLESFSSARALAVVFMCNHCPYVIAVQDRINQLAKKYASQGVALIGINSNDPVKYPDDNFAAMQARSKEQGYIFPYLFDDTQSTAKAYDAVCTPDPFVFERVSDQFLLRYHGRIDDNWKDPKSVKRQELAEALDCILSNRAVNPDQLPAMGCSIKWKA